MSIATKLTVRTGVITAIVVIIIIIIRANAEVTSLTGMTCEMMPALLTCWMLL